MIATHTADGGSVGVSLGVCAHGDGEAVQRAITPGVAFLCQVW